MKLNSYVRSIVRCGSMVLALVFASTHIRADDRDHDERRRDNAGAVFTMDNSAAGNHVLSFRRGTDGELSPAGKVATGGTGTGSGLGSQEALVLSDNSRWLFVCNAGSHEISVFLVTPHGLIKTDQVGSHGKNPISLALHRNLLYVLNAGGQVGDSDNVTGFIFFFGKLHHLPDSTRALSGDNTGPAQITFSRRGDVLVVTEKMTSKIDTYTVDNDGSIDDHKVFASVGQTPFGFAFRGRDLIVSEAFGGAPDASAVSSYDLNRKGELEVMSPSVPTTETAACWVVVTENGRFAYASNTGSGSISGYKIDSDGMIELLDSDGVTGVTGPGSSPIDMALSENSRFLYCLNGGNGTISAFRVRSNGALSSIQTISGIPAGATGLVAR